MCVASGYRATGLVFGWRRGLQSRTPLFMHSWLDVRLFHNQPLWINFSVRPGIGRLFFSSFFPPLLVTYIEIIKPPASLSIHALHPTPVIKDQRGGPPLLDTNMTTPHTHRHTLHLHSTPKSSPWLSPSVSTNLSHTITPSFPPSPSLSLFCQTLCTRWGSVGVALGTWLPHKAMKLRSRLDIFHPPSCSGIQASQDTSTCKVCRCFSTQISALTCSWSNILRSASLFVYSSPDVR